MADAAVSKTVVFDVRVRLSPRAPSALFEPVEAAMLGGFVVFRPYFVLGCFAQEKEGVMDRGVAMKRSESIAFSGLSIALLTVCSWVSIPFGPVPFTLQTMMLAFIVVLFPAREALMSVFGYLIIGAIGVPVFSGMTGGLGAIMGPTGGFLMGFGVGTALVALLSSRWKEPEGKLAATMREASFAVILLLCSYACGWVQFMTVTGMEPLAAFAVSIAPFIVLDVVKMSVGVSLAHMLKVAVPALRRKKI